MTTFKTYEMADLRKPIRFDKCDCQVSILGVKSPGIRVEHLQKGVKQEKHDTGKEKGGGKGRRGRGGGGGREREKRKGEGGGKGKEGGGGGGGRGTEGEGGRREVGGEQKGREGEWVGIGNEASIE